MEGQPWLGRTKVVLKAIYLFRCKGLEAAPVLQRLRGPQEELGVMVLCTGRQTALVLASGAEESLRLAYGLGASLSE